MKSTSLTHLFIKLFVFLFSIVLIITSCNLIDDLFGDDTKNGNDNISDTGSLEIGSDGGTVSLNNLEISVPANAFDDNNDITINVLVGDDGFGEYRVSPVYQIEGLPGSTNKPIKITIKYNGTLTGDPLVAIGEMQYAVSLDSSLYTYEPEVAVDSSGYLIYYLPAYSNQIKSAQVANSTSSDAINILALGGYNQVLSSGGNFLLSYPTLFSQYGSLMGQYFEAAFNTCENMGFNFKNDRNWPVSVIAKGLSSDDNNTSGWYSYRLSNPSGKPDVTDQEIRSFFNKGEFTININILSDDLELRATAGHEFLHLVQNMYEFSDPNVEPEQGWLEEATSVWIEEKFSTVQNYVSSSHNQLEMYLFDGWQFADRGYVDNGYGLSPIFKGVTERYGDGAMVKIFEKIESGILPSNPVDPVEAVLSVITEPIGNFWHGVLGSYVLGNYYNNQVNFKFLDDFWSYSHFTIDPVNNNIPVNLSYHDLSGKLFKIVPGDFSTMTTVPLSFTVSDAENCGILVCKYKPGTEIASLGEVFPGGSGQVILDDVKPVFDDGYELVVMVSNSTHDKNKNYQGTNSVDLNIEIKSTDLNSLLKSSSLEQILVRVNMYSPSEGNVETDFYCSFEFDDICSDSVGFSIDGKYYTSIEQSNNPLYECRLDLTFNNDRTKIEYIKAYKHYIDPTYSSPYTQDLEAEFIINEPIPITTTDLTIINNNNYIEYYLEKGLGTAFDSWAKEYIYEEGYKNNVPDWTYKDTEGDQRHLKVQLKFRLN